MSEKVEIRSTSLSSSICSDYTIRSGDRTRLIFRPELLENKLNPAAAVKGRFIYQKKRENDVWNDDERKNLNSLTPGDGFQLEIKSGELLSLLQHLAMLYRYQTKHGLPKGRVELLKVGQNLAKLLQFTEPELNEFLSENKADAVSILRRVLKWLSERPEMAASFASEDNGLLELNTLMGLANLRAALTLWNTNRENTEEEFWQKALTKHAFVLSHIFAVPVVIIKEKAYVGGKRVDDKHGSLVDFLGQIETTNAAVLVEIKTPSTPLLGSVYRQDVFPLSKELGGAISQVLSYRESLMHNLHSLEYDRPGHLSAAEPRCFIIAGSVDAELSDKARKLSFERFRDRLVGVTVITFDELFNRIKALVALFEDN